MQLLSASWITQGSCTHTITTPSLTPTCLYLIDFNQSYWRPLEEGFLFFLLPGAFDWFWSLLDCPSENNTHNCCGNVKQTDTSTRLACKLLGK